MNIAILSGRVTKDLVHFTDENTKEKKVRTTLATHEHFTNEQGEKAQSTDFHQIIFSSELYESAVRYIKQNVSITIRGTIKNRIKNGSTYNYILVDKWEFQNNN